MPNNHEGAVPLRLETVLARLSELEPLFGGASRHVVLALREGVTAAMAARDRGDAAGALAKIGETMERVSRLANALGPEEGELARAAAASFLSALGRGDVARARETAAVMFARSGAVEKKRS